MDAARRRVGLRAIRPPSSGGPRSATIGRSTEQIIAQTERRVLAGKSVPARDKLVSLFEPHADIIVKGSRDVDYGHKLNLTTGRRQGFKPWVGSPPQRFSRPPR